MVPLSLIEKGRRVKIVKIDAGWGLTKRLTELGLVPEAEIEIVSHSKDGPFTVSVKGARLILGYGIAQKIKVK